MADDRHYVPGSYYRIDDLTGFKVRAERTKKQWNNYYVREKSWEPRNAQDFVRGRRDDQTVADARPRSPNVFLGEISTLAITAPIRTTQISLVSPIGVKTGDTVAIMLDNGVNFFVRIALGFINGGDFGLDFGPDFSGSATTFFLDQPLPYQASAGEEVINTDFIPVQPQTFPGLF